MKELTPSVGQEYKKKRNDSADEWDNGFNGRRTDSFQEETLVVLVTGLILVNGHNHPLLL